MEKYVEGRRYKDIKANGFDILYSRERGMSSKA
jgi:hypothetical protein